MGGAGWAGGALDTGWMDGQVDGQSWQWTGLPCCADPAWGDAP